MRQSNFRKTTGANINTPQTGTLGVFVDETGALATKNDRGVVEKVGSTLRKVIKFNITVDTFTLQENSTGQTITFTKNAVGNWKSSQLYVGNPDKSKASLFGCMSTTNPTAVIINTYLNYNGNGTIIEIKCFNAQSELVEIYGANFIIEIYD